MRKVLVIDPECRSCMDHYCTVTDYLTRSLGDMEKTVVVNRKADRDLGFASDVTVMHWPDDRTLAGRMFRWVRRSERYRAAQLGRNAEAIATLVKRAGLGPDDMLVVPSTTAGIAHALALAIRNANPDTWPYTHIRFLGTGFTGDEARDTPGHMALARAARDFARLRVYCETVEMAATFRRSYPYPDVGEWQMPMVIKPSMDMPEKGDPANGFVVGFLGGKRPEQGMAQIPAILRRLAELLRQPENASLDIRVLFQQPGEKTVRRMDDAQRAAYSEVQAGDGLHERLRMEFLDPEIGNDAFREAIARAHVVVLPYEVASYAERGSGLVTECGLSGTPVILARGLAMKNWQELAGSPTAENPDEFAEAILKVARDYPAYRQGALRAGEAMRAGMEKRIEAIRSASA